MWPYSFQIWFIFDVSSWRNMKNQALHDSHFAQKSRKRRIHQQETREHHSAFPDSWPCARYVYQTQITMCTFWKETLFCSGGFELVSYSGLLIRCNLYHRILFYYYAETKEMIYESVNSKGIVYKPQQTSHSLYSMTTCTGFANVGPVFYKFHSLISAQVFNWIE